MIKYYIVLKCNNKLTIIASALEGPSAKVGLLTYLEYQVFKTVLLNHPYFGINIT